MSVNDIVLICEGGAASPATARSMIVGPAIEPGPLGSRHLGQPYTARSPLGDFQIRYAGTLGQRTKLLACFSTTEDFRCWKHNRESVGLKAVIVWERGNDMALEAPLPKPERRAANQVKRNPPALRSAPKYVSFDSRLVTLLKSDTRGLTQADLVEGSGLSPKQVEQTLKFMRQNGQVGIEILDSKILYRLAEESA